MSGDEVNQFLQGAREQGLAGDEGRVIDGAGGVEAPIRDFSGEVIAALGVGYILATVSNQELEIITRSVVQTAQDISRHVGYSVNQP